MCQSRTFGSIELFALQGSNILSHFRVAWPTLTKKILHKDIMIVEVLNPYYIIEIFNRCTSFWKGGSLG